VREKNMFMNLAEPGTKNECAGEAQQKFTRTRNSIKPQLMAKLKWEKSKNAMHEQVYLLRHHLL
jgi:hypothetical protein